MITVIWYNVQMLHIHLGLLSGIDSSCCATLLGFCLVIYHPDSVDGVLNMPMVYRSVVSD